MKIEVSRQVSRTVAGLVLTVASLHHFESNTAADNSSTGIIAFTILVIGIVALPWSDWYEKSE